MENPRAKGESVIVRHFEMETDIFGPEPTDAMMPRGLQKFSIPCHR
jgi:hypothetical protein